VKFPLLTFLVLMVSWSSFGQSQLPIQYSGSSTIGRCLMGISNDYDKASISFNTSTESNGGLEDLLAGKCDVAGFAGQLPSKIKDKDISYKKIGRDAIGVIVHDKSPVKDLSSEQLRLIFTGKISNWSEVGGPDHSIEVYIMDESSATHFVFRRELLRNETYAFQEVVSPDSVMVSKISNNPYSIGQVSLSFLHPFDGVRPVQVDAQLPSVFNMDYPIGRDLLLLYWTKNAGASNYVKWISENQSENLIQCGFQVKLSGGLDSLKYIGSSTIGQYMEEAANHYPLFKYGINTLPESEGGEEAILANKCDVAGVARTPSEMVLNRGLRSTYIGADAIAVIANTPEIKSLSTEELQKIYTGAITNWKDLGRTEGAINCFRVSPNSATYHLFKKNVLGGEPYGNNTREIADNELVGKVKSTSGSIGFVTRSFLDRESELVVNVDGFNPWNDELNYPLKRPLFLIWNENNNRAIQFINWVLSPEGQELATDLYTGSKAQFEISKEGKTGVLKVYTDVKPTTDAQVLYYPHTGYEIRSMNGKLIRYISNNRGINDELPETVYLNEGKYIIVPETQMKEEFVIEIVAGKTTVLHTREKPKEEVKKYEEKIRSKYIQLYGDMRLRVNYDDNNGTERLRGRYRFRIGTNIQLTKDLIIGARLVSTDNLKNYKSTHVDISSFGQLGVGLDRLFIHYNPQKQNWFHLWVGKYALPYHSYEFYPENVWDEDIQPEGISMAIKKNFENSSNFSFTGGYYFFGALTNSSNPPSMLSNELYYSNRLKDNLSISFFNKFFGYIDVKGLNTQNEYFVPNGGNQTTSDSSSTYYQNDFSINSTAVQFKLFKGNWPLLLKGEYIQNLSASNYNQGYTVGVGFGQLGRRNGLQAYVQYQEIQQESVFTPFTQDDFLEQTQFSGVVAGLSWSLNRKMRLHGWVLTSTHETTQISKNRFRIDLDIKF